MRHLIQLATLLLGLHAGSACAQTPPSCLDISVMGSHRLTAVISDLHLGPGRLPNGKWDPKEDFRWPDALRGFLAEVSACGKDRVDLVIAGDLLELWQPPAGFECKDVSGNRGCTGAEMSALVGTIVTRHRHVLRTLGDFARRGDNRIHVVPGNHDAALLLPQPWSYLSSAIDAPGRVLQVASGTWVSSDGRIVVEHGHQVGRDVNRFPEWPKVTEPVDGQERFFRPWGENFVQTLFNAEEDSYSVIDNLSPESAGARFRMADKGLWNSIVDVARFVSFNLFETSLEQKADVLGGAPAGGSADIPIGRALGHRLFVEALPADDPFRIAVMGQDERAAQLRKALDTAASDSTQISDDEVVHLCSLLEQRSGGKVRCAPDVQGAAAQSTFVSRSRVLGEYLQGLLDRQPYAAMRYYVYAHTHLAEGETLVAATPMRTVRVLNTGAFQRVINEEDFVALAKKRNLSPAAALKSFTVEDLAPCYSAVLIAPSDAGTTARLMQWHMREGPGSTGKFVGMNDAACRP